VRNLAEGMVEQLRRNRELLKAYEELGPSGSLGAHFIRLAIREGEDAQASGDVVRMIRSYKALEENN
jgi:hypothetical protein